MQMVALTFFLGIVLCGCMASFVMLMEWILRGTVPTPRGLLERMGEALGVCMFVGLLWFFMVAGAPA